MGRRADKPWYFEDNPKLKDAFISLVALDETLYSFTGGKGKECSVYYLGQVLYKIEVQENGELLKLEFNMGHFRFWDGNDGMPERVGKDLAPNFESIWDETWRNISASLQPKLDRALEVCTPFVFINLSVQDYAVTEKGLYLAHEKNPTKKKKSTTWSLTAKIRTVQDAKKFKDQFVPLLKTAVERFQDEMNRNERMEAQKLQNFCSAEAYAKGETPLFFAECEYNLNDGESNRLLNECCKNFTCDPKIFKGKNKKGKDTIVSIGKPDGIGLLRYKGKERPCVIEIKYETAAIKGSSGICRHLRDMCAIAQDAKTMSRICKDLSFGFTDKLALKGVSVPDERLKKYGDADSINNDPLLLFIMFADSDAASIKEAVENELHAEKAYFRNEYPEILFAIQRNSNARVNLSDYYYYQLTSNQTNTSLSLNDITNDISF